MSAIWYTVGMKTPEHTTMRVWKKTLKKIRMIYALTGDSMVEILDRAIAVELKKVQDEQAEAQQDA